jgi:anti-sigma factor RsiW
VHPTESALLALAHGECSAARTAALRMHLGRCDDCRERYEALAGTDRLVASLLACLDESPPSVPLSAVRRAASVGHPRAIAAGIAILLAVAGAAIAAVPESPFRAWMKALGASHAASPRPAPAPGPAAPTPTSGGVTVTVDTAATIVLRRAQTAGEIRLRRTDQPTVTVRAFGGDVGYTVSPGRVVVDNRAPASRVEIALPRGVRAAAVVVGGRVLWRMPSAQAARGSAPDSLLVFDLSDSNFRSSHP